MNNMSKIQDPRLGKPVTIVTGATEGIGRALADEFARAGHDLLLVARDATKLARTADQIALDHPVTVKITAQDLSTAEGCEGVELALRRFGLYADILVNNAGIMRSGFAQDQRPETIRRVIDLNVRAAIDLTLRFLPGMVAKGRGGILNVSSMLGFMPVPYQAGYGASKAALTSFTKALAWEAMGTGVKVSVLAPGVVATGLHRRAGSQNSRYLFWLPAWTPENVARVAYRRFTRGATVIVPGIFNQIGALAVRIVPDLLVVALMGWFFRVRDQEGNVLMPGRSTEPALKRHRERVPARVSVGD